MATLATSRIEPRTRPEKGDCARPRDRLGSSSGRRVDEILGRRPAVGLAVGVVRDGRLEFFDGRGSRTSRSNTPITEDTVFRIGSITKLFTAIAVMQLVGAGPGRPRRARERLPARLSADPGRGRLPARDAAPSAHPHGRDPRRPPDVRPAPCQLQSVWRATRRSSAWNSGSRCRSLAEYYRGGLRIVVEPGSAFAYSNHGYATLGQIVEDVSGIPLERFFRERIFEPLGMADTDLVRSDRIASHLATGYAFGRRGATAVPDRDWIGAGAGGIYSTTRDLARFVAALLGGGANEHGRVLQPATLATMFEAHYQPDVRLPGMGLGFFRAEAAGHRLVLHDGILPGFNSELLVAPDDGIGLSSA